jgi:glycosyltransferase involved in cell wall biosynthesis
VNDLEIKSNPLVSVVMPTYNGADFIHDAIQSILDQSYSNFELIVVDDGSTDNTSEIVNAFTDKRITYIKKPKNSGIADSLNLGISKARGSYFARMDDDDVSREDRLQKQVEFLETHKDVVVCATNDQNLGGERPYLSDQEIKIGLLFRNVIIHASVMMPMTILETYKYDVNRVPSEDYDLWSRILNEGKFHKLPEPLMQIRYASDGQTATRRHEQLKLNVDICKRFLSNDGFKLDKDKEYILYSFIEHDYSITGSTLLKLLDWLEAMKFSNKILSIFPQELCIDEIEFQKQNFIKKYFINRKVVDKIEPFIKLPIRYKLFILRYYIGSLLKK